MSEFYPSNQSEARILIVQTLGVSRALPVFFLVFDVPRSSSCTVGFFLSFHAQLHVSLLLFPASIHCTGIHPLLLNFTTAPSALCYISALYICLLLDSTNLFKIK